jgi:7-carboxy-7-deazaguanine synthase
VPPLLRFDRPNDLAMAALNLWPGCGEPFTVLTGGEPLLQVDEALIGALHNAGFEVAVETNGTVPVPAGVDWVCVSPKAGSQLVVTAGEELKVVWPQPGIDLDQLLALDFKHYFLQPLDQAGRTEENTRRVVEYVRSHPRWRISLQAHKLLSIP